MVLGQIKVHVDGARRLTAPGDTIDCSWDCSTQDGVGGIRYRINGGSWSVVSVKTTRRPNYSPMPSRMPGAPVGTMASFVGYGVILLASVLPLGAVQVEAEALDGALTPIGALETIRFYNDSDGLDRRPSTREVWLDADAGDDANTGYGGWGNAVRTRHRAMAQARATPGGATVGALDAGGAVIHCRGTFTDGESGGTAPQWHTSGFWWLTMVGHDGCKWNRTNVKFYDVNTGNLFCNGHGLGPSVCRLRLQGIDIDGAGPTLYSSGQTNVVTIHAWLEGGRWGSPQFVDGQIRVRYHEHHKDQFCDVYSASGTPYHRYITGVLRQGCNIGLNSPTFAHDVVIDSTLGGDIYYVGSAIPTSKSICVRTRRHNNERNTTVGWAANKTSLGAPEQLEGQILAGAGTGGSDALRILGPVGGLPFGDAAADLIGAVHTRIGVFGWPDNDGSWPVLAGGTIGGRPYVDLDHATGVAGLAPGGADIETVCRNDNGSWQRFNNYIHPSFKSFDGRGRTGDVFHTCTAEDMDHDIQASFANGFDATQLWFCNVRDSGNGFPLNWRATAIDGQQSSITDSLIEDCTFSGTLAIADGNFLPYTGTKIRNCVFGQAQPSTADAVAAGLVVENCHFVSGPTFGAGATSGSWFKAPGPTSSPFHMEPLDVWKGGGSGASGSHIADWSWTGTTAATKGVITNTGRVSWAEGTPGALADCAAPAWPTITVPNASAEVGGTTVADCDPPDAPTITVTDAVAFVEPLASCPVPSPMVVAVPSASAWAGAFARCLFLDDRRPFFGQPVTNPNGLVPLVDAVVGALAACDAPVGSTITVPTASATTDGGPMAVCPPPAALTDIVVPAGDAVVGVAADCTPPAAVATMLFAPVTAFTGLAGPLPPSPPQRKLWLRAPRKRIPYRPAP